MPISGQEAIIQNTTAITASDTMIASVSIEGHHQRLAGSVMGLSPPAGDLGARECGPL